MKVIYGKGICIVQGGNVSNVVIKYRGNPYLSHNHFEFIDIISETKARANNINSNSLVLHGNNQIHIGYKDVVDGEVQLFRYTGYFKILSAKINNESVTIETQNIDLCQLINSKFDNMGKPEQYKGTYTNGLGTKYKSNAIEKAFKRIKRLSKARKRTKAVKGTTRSY